MSAKKWPACVRVVVCHQLTLDLAVLIGLPERVVFVDPLLEGSCGAIKDMQLEPALKALGPVGHSTKPGTLLGLSHWLYGRILEALMVSMAGARFEPGESLSPEAEGVLPAIRSRIQVFLKDFQP